MASLSSPPPALRATPASGGYVDSFLLWTHRRSTASGGYALRSLAHSHGPPAGDTVALRTKLKTEKLKLKTLSRLTSHVCRLPSKQPSLLAGTPKPGAVQLQTLVVQPIFVRVLPVLLPHYRRNAPFATHPYTPPAVVHFAVMTSLNKVPHLVGPIWKILI